MPDFWQFPTVSMGLGPITAPYQARFMRYLEDRGLKEHQGRKVWAFLGDGETDEPESLGALALGSREKLDNLIFVVNCNLQRLDGPVRGNGKIIRNSKPLFRVLAGMSSRSFGAPIGTTCWLVTPADFSSNDGRVRRWRVSELTRPKEAPTFASTSSANIPNCSNW